MDRRTHDRDSLDSIGIDEHHECVSVALHFIVLVECNPTSSPPGEIKYLDCALEGASAA